MPYFIQVKQKSWDSQSWRTWKDDPFKTAEAAKKAAEGALLKPHEYRVVKSYTVTRYKPVRM